MNYLVIFVDSKIKNIILNICILLFGINFLYKCNYVVMATFILLIVFKKFKINFGNKINLVVLLLFSISWYLFGGHEIAGICLPLCYLIGCNISEDDEKGVIKFILMVATSLALYTTLFFISNAIKNGIGNYDVLNQPNIWTGKPLWATNIMLYSSLFYSCFGYMVFACRDFKTRIIYFIIFVINAFYALMLGRRAALLMIALSMFFSFLYKIICSNKVERKKTLKVFVVLCIIGFSLLILFLALYLLDIGGFNSFIKKTDLFVRFISNPQLSTDPLYHVKNFFYDMGRANIRRGFYAHLFEYPWGGGYIHEIVGNYGHDLWLDIYDVAGIISLTIMIIYNVIYVLDIAKVIKSDRIDSSIKLLLLCIFVCSFAQFFIEPIMEACRAYMFGICLIHGSLERIREKTNA